MQRHFITLLALLVALFQPSGFGQRLTNTMVFAPSEGWIKPAEQPYRHEICLNGLWQFQPVKLPEKFREGIDPAPLLPPVNADGWDKTPIRIPSPWNVNSFADNKGLGGDFRCYPGYPKEWENVKMGWLRKKFTVPEKWKGNRILLHFEAVAGDADIRINGKPVGKHFGIFLPFDVDVTEAVLIGRENELCIGIRKPSLFDRKGDYGRRTYQAGSFWGQHIAGIWQDVYLVGVSPVRISDVFVKPSPVNHKLEAEVTICNDRDDDVRVSLDAKAYPWISKAGKEVLSSPLPDYILGSKASLTLTTSSINVPAHGTVKTVLSATVKEELKYWSPETPYLYGLVIRTTQDGKITDSKYTRFGWRQFEIQGNRFLLNGKPMVMKGDSWHFLGIPQMTRRYPWAWFKALRDANLNTVRLHAEPYPSFYLDVADEMGILVLDETAVWASDGGPKLDDPVYWQDSKSHLSELILRDRNHPCVMGWSVSNEVMPVVTNVMHNPVGIKDTLVKYYGIWADICRKLDPTRPWISADGEDDGEGRLPAYMVHYGGPGAMDRARKNGRPWGVGEAGNAYYGTPEQVAETNGGRAYESFLGRMEGVAASSYQSLIDQRERDASYRSVFNMVWYGLKPLPLGLKDTTKPPMLSDGVYFTSFQEGQPGVQPERLGPYCTTLNPGYDPALPLYQTWPLFDAIHDASAEPPLKQKWGTAAPVASASPAPKPVNSIMLLSGEGSTLASELKRIGVPIAKPDATTVPDLLIVDGTHPPKAETHALLDKVFVNGGTVLVWGAAADRMPALNTLLPAPLEVTSRSASSLLVAAGDEIVSGLTPADLYFSELRPPVFTTLGLDGPLLKQSTVLLKA
ncbi:MAG: glycoside hydrolase family 2 TIM barrel-domain containing protein, partial [Bacteroidota bacterium]|nr:glycoside hydrolase family 2 TIM barrel-domain containing protein [Bacteroidota bacterium]